MPRKHVKLGFKIWCCSCSCCGYLCTFQVYHGASRDLVTGRKVPERGLAKRVVGNLVVPLWELIMSNPTRAALFFFSEKKELFGLVAFPFFLFIENSFHVITQLGV